MFDRRRNNPRKENKNVSMRGIQLYNQGGVEPSTLSLGFWKNFATIKINPMLPKKEQAQGRMYDYDTSISALLSIENIEKLIQAIEIYEDRLFNKKEIEIKAKKKKAAKTAEKVKHPFTNISIECGENIVLKIGNGSEYKDCGPYISILDYSQGNKPNSLLFEFKSKTETPVLINFNEENEKSIHEVYFSTDFNLFKNFLYACREGSMNAHAFGVVNYVMYYFNLILDKIEIFNGKIDSGVFGRSNRNSNEDGSSKFRSGGGRFSQRSKSGGSSSPNKRKPVKEEEIDDIDEIERELENDIEDDE